MWLGLPDGFQLFPEGWLIVIPQSNFVSIWL
jgi:hypothetical protein